MYSQLLGIGALCVPSPPHGLDVLGASYLCGLAEARHGSMEPRPSACFTIAAGEGTTESLVGTGYTLAPVIFVFERSWARAGVCLKLAAVRPFV